MPPIIFPGQPLPTGLGRDDTPAEEKAIQKQIADRTQQAAVAAPDKRPPTAATGLTAAIIGKLPEEKPKHPIEEMLEKEEKDSPLSQQEVQALREIIYRAAKQKNERFELPDLPITDKDRDYFAECVVQHRPYKETFSLMKGKLKVTIREKYKHETDLILATIDDLFAQGRVRSDAAFSTYLMNFGLLFQVVEMNGTTMPIILPNPRPDDWSLVEVAKNHFFEGCGDHMMFLLISILTQFENKVRSLAKEVTAEGFSQPATVS